MRTRFAPTSWSGSATRDATPLPKAIRVGMRKRLTLALARIVTAHGALHGRRSIRRCPATDPVPAPGAIRATRWMRSVAPLDVHVDAREEDSEDRRDHRAPQQEHEEAEQADEASHRLRRDRRAEDRQRVDRARHEQHARARRTTDV